MSNPFHYVLSNRAIEFKPGQARPELDTDNKKLADRNIMHFGLYPINNRNQRLSINAVDINTFTGGISSHVEQLPQGKRDVMLYIHGYDAFPKLKLELLEQVHQKYVADYQTTIGKIIFFSWPSHGFRKKIDDRANTYGQELFQHFPFFKQLSEKLAQKGSRLHLLVHSFGHQLLNGFISTPGFQQLPQAERKIFDQIFLMAPDVPRGCINTAINSNGILVPNRHGNPKERLYNFTLLDDLGSQLHIFYDDHDFLLYLSSKYLISRNHYKTEKEKWKQAGLDFPTARKKFMTVYHILGAWGADTDVTTFSKFNLYNINQLAEDATLKSELKPGRSALPEPDPSALIFIEKLKKNFNYIHLKPGLKALLKLLAKGDLAFKKWANRHRYFITGDIVVLKVKAILEGTPPTPRPPTDILATTPRDGVLTPDG